MIEKDLLLVVYPCSKVIITVHPLINVAVSKFFVLRVSRTCTCL